ncbi:hypothetical protein D5086_002520 [Populus alba]|uniref:Uncharacterized protein n=1 Tax=Populus alba TaxID=43335 RepID=A0ACC4D317_POPAL
MPIMLVKKIIKMEISFRWVAACVSLQVAERVASIKQAAAMENNGVLIEKKFEGEMWWGRSVLGVCGLGGGKIWKFTRQGVAVCGLDCHNFERVGCLWDRFLKEGWGLMGSTSE